MDFHICETTKARCDGLFQEELNQRLQAHSKITAQQKTQRSLPGDGAELRVTQTACWYAADRHGLLCCKTGCTATSAELRNALAIKRAHLHSRCSLC